MELTDDHGLHCSMNEEKGGRRKLRARFGDITSRARREGFSLVTVDHDTDLGEYTVSGRSEHQVFHSATRIVNVVVSVRLSQLVLSGHCCSVAVAARRRRCREKKLSKCSTGTLGRTAEEQPVDVAGGVPSSSGEPCADIVGGVVVFFFCTGQ